MVIIFIYHSADYLATNGSPQTYASWFRFEETLGGGGESWPGRGIVCAAATKFKISSQIHIQNSEVKEPKNNWHCNQNNKI